MLESSAASAGAFISDLGKGREAFHSEVTEFCLRSGERTPEDFLRRFSCSKIMLSLASRPLERARIISELTGVHERVANKLSPENAGETLQIALDEGVTTPTDILRLFQADDRQRYLSRHELWAFDTEGEPRSASASDAARYARAERYTAYIIERALENLLVSHQEIVAALGVVKLAGWLPSELLGQIIEASLAKPEKFTDEDLLRAAPPSSLASHVPLDYLWDKVVVPLIAVAHDYVPKPSDGKPDSDWGDDALKRSLRPAAESDSQESKAAPPEDSDVVGEDEIILTEDEVRASESGAALGVRKASAGAPPKKAHQG